MSINSKERKRAEYMYNLGKQSTKLSKKGKREFNKIIKEARRPYRGKRVTPQMVVVLEYWLTGNECWWKELSNRNIEFAKRKSK